MGITYEELSVFGRLRKIEKCGPYSTFTKLVREWGSFLSPIQVVPIFLRDGIPLNPLHRSLRKSNTSSLSMPGTGIK